jgi:hypothetical protein
MELFTIGDTVFLSDEIDKRPRPKYRIIQIQTKPLGTVEPAPEEFHNKNLVGVRLREPNIFLKPLEEKHKLPRENPFDVSELEHTSP